MKIPKLFTSIILIFSLITLITPISYAAQGTGILYVYWDASYTSLVGQNQQGQYDVYPGVQVYIQIAGITEFGVGTEITVKICWSGHVKTLVRTIKTLTSGNGAGLAGVGDAADPIQWTVGDFNDGFYEIPYCETMTVHYKNGRPDYIAQFMDANGRMTVAHLHSVPENPLGTLGTISAIFLGLWIFLIKKGKTLNFKTI